MPYAERRPQYSIRVKPPTPAPTRQGDDARSGQLMQGPFQAASRSAGQVGTGLPGNASTSVAENLRT